MSACGIDDGSQLPTLRTCLTGRGEDAMRMDKRLRCAGRALGIRVEVGWNSSRYGGPEVRVGDQLVVDHLVDTAELEVLLQPFAERARHKAPHTP